jgi:hypothetical protein
MKAGRGPRATISDAQLLFPNLITFYSVCGQFLAKNTIAAIPSSTIWSNIEDWSIEQNKNKNKIAATHGYCKTILAKMLTRDGMSNTKLCIQTTLQ